MNLDNIFDNHKNMNDIIEPLSELVFKKIIERFGPIYPLQFGIDDEEILVGELARLNTVLMMLESREEYEKCVIVKNRIRNIEATLKNNKDDDNKTDASPQI
tara:strand:+ start:418 stop:723 length:306 start_codon:yes stop_codon:yes gene_type:complete